MIGMFPAVLIATPGHHRRDRGPIPPRFAPVRRKHMSFATTQPRL
jgi:hypothetical protein